MGERDRVTGAFGLDGEAAAGLDAPPEHLDRGGSPSPLTWPVIEPDDG
jgi:hypothetical protein